jgi:hypothetical protein
VNDWARVADDADLRAWAHVRPRLHRIHQVQRIADRGRQHLRLEAVVAVDLADVADQVHAHRADVVEAPEEGADVGRARLGREQGLGR